MAKKNPPIPSEVTVEVDGEQYSGSYTVESSTVCVSSAYGYKATQPGASAEMTAKMLLREIIRETGGKL